MSRKSESIFSIKINNCLSDTFAHYIILLVLTSILIKKSCLFMAIVFWPAVKGLIHYEISLRRINAMKRISNITLSTEFGSYKKNTCFL